MGISPGDSQPRVPPPLLQLHQTLSVGDIHLLWIITVSSTCSYVHTRLIWRKFIFSLTDRLQLRITEGCRHCKHFFFPSSPSLQPQYVYSASDLLRQHLITQLVAGLEHATGRQMHFSTAGEHVSEVRGCIKMGQYLVKTHYWENLMITEYKLEIEARFIFEMCKLKILSCERVHIFERYVRTYVTLHLHKTAVGFHKCHLHRVCSFYFQELIIGTEPPATNAVSAAWDWWDKIRTSTMPPFHPLEMILCYM